MKKTTFAIATVLISLLGISSFKKNKQTITYYWFLIDEGQSDLVSSLTSVFNYQVSFLKVGSTVALGGSPCDAVNLYHCIIGFTGSQVEKSGSTYILFTTGAPIAPQTAPHGATKSAYVRSTE